MEKRYSIICNSLTGNTRKLADTIRETLPEENCDYFGSGKEENLNSGVICVGFWTDKGNADSATLELLKTLRNKEIFLFGTAGFGGSEAYFQKILANVRASVDASNTIIGEYMCQGKMPMSVRERYMKMKEMPDQSAKAEALIENFDRALSHPDEKDLAVLKEMIESTF